MDDPRHIQSPLQSQFDAVGVTWHRNTDVDGKPGRLEIGYADNGMVGMRYANEPGGTMLIYTPKEWDAFLDGVHKGEFDVPPDQ
ncbi:MAG TPA: DUF397 domain-containing protein [Candidatus Stackebrandtia faecavium]|nr:DUF397 domain-containing protein [Candidatus Stackebrandtia faecavium]